MVLLDEADVFLEERSPADQKQNVVVSSASQTSASTFPALSLIYRIVFLRLLEYYDGILILTTNRVGTFDEAFTSRIHLALRYDRLNEKQRAGIWRNLLNMLKDRTRDLAEAVKIGERADTGDLVMNIDKLAREALNGRQIRNVITLARYLAKFRGEMLVYKDVQDAIASIVKFDRYLLGLRGADDEWRRVRLCARRFICPQSSHDVSTECQVFLNHPVPLTIETQPASSWKTEETGMLPDLTMGKRHSEALRIPSNVRLGNLATSNGRSRDTESWSPSMRCWVAMNVRRKKGNSIE